MVEPESGSDLLIRLENAAFSFGDTVIFRDVNLAVQKGQILCLLGPNGCGKTTLIDCILGIHPLKSGRVLFSKDFPGRLSINQMARSIAYVPQKHDRHFSFSVMDVLLMGRAPYTSFYSLPKTPDIEMAKDVLTSFNLSHLMNRDYTRLSGGESQLVMIMRALVQDTPVIIMDEPTAHLDFKHELIVLETIVRLVKERHMTLIMATHFPNHAFYFENQDIPVEVAFMDHQQVHPAGPPSLALTEENLARFYHVHTAVITHSRPETGMVKYIIPINTLKNESDPLK